MATYATSTDVQRHAGGAKRLLEISDFDGNGVEDADLVTGALDAAEATINSYARKGYEVPFVVVPPSIREMTAGLAVYELKCWRDALTEADIVKQDARIKWLENLAKGLVDPGITPAPPVSGHVASSNTERPSAKAVSREKLKGFA